MTALSRRAVEAGGFVYVTSGRNAATKHLVFDDEGKDRIKALALFLTSSMRGHARECLLGGGEGDVDEPEGLWEARDTLRSLLAGEPAATAEPADVTAALVAGFAVRRSGAIPTGDGGHVDVLVAVHAAPQPPQPPQPAHSAQSATMTHLTCATPSPGTA